MNRISDQEMDEVIGAMLRYGVLLSAAVVAAGGTWYLLRYGATAPDYHVFHGEPEHLRTLRGIAQGIRGFHARSVIQLGLVLLIATPVARVAFSVAAFYRQRDYVYVGITLLVLGILLFSLLGKH